MALNNLMSTGQNRPKLSHAVLNIAVKEKVRMRVLKENSRIIFASLKKKVHRSTAARERDQVADSITQILPYFIRHNLSIMCTSVYYFA